jgi:TRAP-type C4-dicarboxylate transport system permease small subunit
LLTKPASYYERLLAHLGTLVGLLIALCAVMISTEVIMRNFGFGGISWLNEVIEYFLYAATFMAAPWALNQGAHIRVDIVVTLLPRPVAFVVELIADLLGTAISVGFVIYGGQAVIEAYEGGTIQYKMLAVPEWWLFAVVPVFSALLAIEFAARFARALRAKSKLDDDLTSEGF